MAPLHQRSGQVPHPLTEQWWTLDGIVYVLSVLGMGLVVLSVDSAFLMMDFAMLGWLTLHILACLLCIACNNGSCRSSCLCVCRWCFKAGLLSSCLVLRNTWSCLHVAMGMWFLAFCIIRLMVASGYSLFLKWVVSCFSDVSWSDGIEVLRRILKASPYMMDSLVDLGWFDV